MARRSSLLAPAVAAIDTSANENERSAAPIAAPAAIEQAPRRKNPNAGKFHVGGYYDPQDATVEAFRILATRQRRSQQELLLEAMADLVAKHEAGAKFASR